MKRGPIAEPHRPTHSIFQCDSLPSNDSADGRLRPVTEKMPCPKALDQTPPDVLPPFEGIDGFHREELVAVCSSRLRSARSARITSDPDRERRSGASS